MKYEPIVGKYKIRADANESFINPLDYLKDEILSVCEKLEFNRYPNPDYKNLVSAFAEYLDIDENKIVAFNGSDESLSVLINAFTQNNDKVLCFDPDFSMYQIYFEENKTNLIKLPKKDGLYIDFDGALKLINEEQIKLCLFSNPCNPTSVGEKRDVIIDFIGKAQEKDCIVVVDEAYMNFWNQSVAKDVDRFDNLIVLKTCSKAMGMAALRVGFSISDKNLATKLRNFKSPYNISTPDTEFATLILRRHDIIDMITEKIKSSNRSLLNQLKKLDGKDFEIVDSDTNFVYIKTNRADDLDDFLRKNNISIRKFDKAVRITCCKEEDNLEIIEKIKEFLGGENENG